MHHKHHPWTSWSASAIDCHGISQTTTLLETLLRSVPECARMNALERSGVLEVTLYRERRQGTSLKFKGYWFEWHCQATHFFRHRQGVLLKLSDCSAHTWKRWSGSTFPKVLLIAEQLSRWGYQLLQFKAAHGVDDKQKLHPGASSARAAASKLSINTAHLLFAMLPWQTSMGPCKSCFHKGALSIRCSARESWFTANHRMFVMHISCLQVSLLLCWCSLSCSASVTIIIFIRVARFHTLPFRYRKYIVFAQIWRKGQGHQPFDNSDIVR